MGCCVSSAKKKDNDNPLKLDHRSGPEPRPPSPKRTHVESRAPPPPPPPPPFEEETVKEVLSETPSKKPSVAEEREVGAVAGAVARKLREDEAGTKVLISKLEEVAEIVSEYSEMCSATASLSTATTATTATEKRDNEVTSRDTRDLVKRRRVAANRSPVKVPVKRVAGEIPAGRERRGPKPPSHSPARVPGGGPRMTSARGGRDLSGELRPPRPEEDSRRRQSRSPATRREREAGPNRGGMVRRPVKETEVSSGAGRSLELGAAEDRRRKAEEEETRGGRVPEQGNEDLDNPNVSLECFIFL